MVVSPAPSFTPSTVEFMVREPASDCGPPSDDDFLVDEPRSGQKNDGELEEVSNMNYRVLATAGFCLIHLVICSG